MTKYIDAEKLKAEIERLHNEYLLKDNCSYGVSDICEKIEDFITSLQQEHPKEPLNENEQKLVDIFTERMLKGGPIPTLKGKQKADFEKEFNRFKQIAGMINWPAREEIYKKIILWFMAWSVDNLPNLGKPIDPEMDVQQEQPEVDLEKEIEDHAICMPMSEFTHDSEAECFIEWAREEFKYFFELGLKAGKGE